METMDYMFIIENYFEPIYYDGEFDLKKKIEVLHYPLSLNYNQSIDSTIDLIKSVDKEKLILDLKSRNLVLSDKKLNKKLNHLIKNLTSLKKIFNEKNED